MNTNADITDIEKIATHLRKHCPKAYQALGDDLTKLAMRITNLHLAVAHLAAMPRVTVSLSAAPASLKILDA